jgi:hypothetical protein
MFGGLEFRGNAGLGIWPIEEKAKLDSTRARQVPLRFVKVPSRRAGAPRGTKKPSENRMGIEWIAAGVVLAAGAIFFGLPLGVLVGYTWRDRISRERRARFIIEQARRRAEHNSGGVTAAFR